MSKLIAFGGVAGIGGIGVCSYAAYTMMQPSNVKEALIKNNFKLTSELEKVKSDSAWKKVEETYKVEATKDTQIGGKAISETTAKDIEDWCKESLDIRVKDKSYESTYSKASKWCVVYTTIAEKIESEKKTISADASGLATKYNSMPPELKKEITNESSNQGQKTKEWCEKNSKRSFSGTEDTYYKHLVSYCLTK